MYFRRIITIFDEKMLDGLANNENLEHAEVHFCMFCTKKEMEQM